MGTSEPTDIPDPKKPERTHAAIGQDTVVINNDTIVERYSSLYKTLMDLDAATDTDVQKAIELSEREEEFFRNILGRTPSESQYVIRRQFARGGMGILYNVYDRDFRRDVVMKVLLPDLKQDMTLINAFIREARITGQLEHPNIVPVHDMGYMDDEGIYFTMKHVQGEGLNEILYQLEVENPNYVERYDFYGLLNIFRKVCDAVAFAHANRVLHRDIKPHNIMVGSFGEVFLMDWGLAKHVGEATAVMPLPDFIEDEAELSGRVVKGSPGYMSPEQASGEELDERSDIFLLGATLYHMFTYFPPYIGSSMTTILKNARECEYIRLRQVSFGPCEIPEALGRIIRKAMQAKKDDRYQSVQELTEDLDALIHGKMETVKKTFRPGQFLIREGESSGPSFVIVRGAVEVFKGDPDNKTTLDVLGPGDIVGEMALITHHPRSASVQALQHTDVMVMNSELFEQNLSRLQPWLRRTVSALAERLAETDRKLARHMEDHDGKDG